MPDLICLTSGYSLTHPSGGPTSGVHRQFHMPSNDPMWHTPLKRYILLFILIILITLIFIGAHDNYSSRSYKSLRDLGHILFFFLFPFLLRNIKYTPRNYLTQIIIILTITTLIGITVELFQNGSHRIPDISDLYRNTLGAMAFIFFLEPSRMDISRKIVVVMQFVTVTLIGLQIVLAVVALVDDFAASKQFPELSGFEKPFEIHRWSGDADFQIDKITRKKGKASLRVSLSTGKYSGISLMYFPRNWKGFRYFQAQIFNPSTKSIFITCRIHDKKHMKELRRYEDRFDKVFKILPGWNQILVNLEDVKNAPKNRLMEMKEIHRVAFFVNRLPFKSTIYIDDVKLSI